MIIEKILVSVSSNSSTLNDTVKSVTRRKINNRREDNDNLTTYRLFNFNYLNLFGDRYAVVSNSSATKLTN